VTPLLEQLAQRVRSGRRLFDMADGFKRLEDLSDEEIEAIVRALPSSVLAEAELADALPKSENFGEPRLYPPANIEQITAAEARLGFALPELLRDIYLQIGNGGFGPGYGLIGIEGGATDYRDRSLEQVYESFRRSMPGLPSPWSEQWLIISEYGCGIWECLDCSQPDGKVYYYDPNIPGDGPWGDFLVPEFNSLEEWLDLWLRVDDPFKRRSSTVDFESKFRDIDARRAER
jgi:hypothetical protein